MPINQIIINGQKTTTGQPSSQSDGILELRESYTLENATRGISDSHHVKIDENEVVELIFDDNTTWFCNSSTIEEIFPEATVQSRGFESAFVIPQTLKGEAEDRGIVNTILLKVINIFVKKEIATTVEELAERLEKKQLENQNGLYRISPAFDLTSYTTQEVTQPILLFLHGTASSTISSFGGLAKSDTWNYICQSYKNNILAFQHQTLTKSPLENVLELVKQLPSNTDLHLISHSRGGLVGEILARFATTDENNRGFDLNEKNYLKKEKRDSDLNCIEQITAALRNKKIKISKFIRVACPASGTILASKRLDNFFNLTFNLIGYGTGLAANPVYGLFKDLIGSILDSKNNTSVLPGLEAMNPDSPFIKVLNNPQSAISIDDHLYVISGNSHARISLKALLILASKLFYTQDNDLIVNTRSMYLGSKRSSGQFYFDESTETDHFHYFKNEVTSSAIKRVLSAPGSELVIGFRPILQIQDEQQRNILLNLEGGQVFTDTVTGKKPILVLLPGIMGSNLAFDKDVLWIDYWKFIGGGLNKLDIKNSSSITAPSLIKTSYKKLVDHFSAKYDVVTFPFDWRLQLNESAALFNKKIEELLKYNQPIKIIGHSMGGVLVRDFIVSFDDTWQKLNRRPGFKLIFLGAPLGGSFRIPSVLFGQDAIIKKLSKIDIFHTKQELIGVFAKLPGILSLLPLTQNGAHDFSNAANWSKMASATAGGWPVPQQADLETFKKYREANLKAEPNIDYTNVIYIAGRDKVTPCDYQVNTNGELVFYNTAEGDASVTWASGIPPRMIEKNSVYYVNVTHGSLANEPSIFKGIGELLEKGTTALLSNKRPQVRSQDKLFIAPVTDDFDITQKGLEKTILGLSDVEEEVVVVKPVKVMVSNGDLRYAAYPVLAGHFNRDGILQAEREIDISMNNALSDRHRLLLYPGEIGTSEIIMAGKIDIKGAIIVGLGDYGSLTAFQLEKTVEQAIAKYLISVANSSLYSDLGISKASAEIGISSLIIGCGYGGLSIEGSIRAVIQGVRNANTKIAHLLGNNAKTVEMIEFIELYDDRALSCLYSLKKIASEQIQGSEIQLPINSVKQTFGAKARIPEDASNSWWTRITVCVENDPDLADSIGHLSFSVSTGGAREETKELFTSRLIIDQFIEEISVNQKWSPELSKTIFELLIPNDFKDQLKKQNNINWVLDKYTASLPWELLHDKANDVKPICINSGMVRQLKTDAYRQRINLVMQETALIVADPDLKGFANQLPGARKEGELVTSLLQTSGFDTTVMLSESPFNIIQSLFDKDYKIIHLSGHGVFNEKNPESSGMLIGNNVFLSTREICQMSTVPELVFVNCCHLGKMDNVAEELYRSRYKLAANIGTQLIENGVKAVIVAGWAVDDAAALLFTEKFYEAMFANDTFGESIRKARVSVYDKYKNLNNTWGAYQCYGDPFYKFRNISEEDRSYKLEFTIAKEAEIQLFNLKNELETGRHTTEYYLELLEKIIKALKIAGIENALISEYIVIIYAELGKYEEALAAFGNLFKIEKAGYTVATQERYYNIKAKYLTSKFLESQGKETGGLKEMENIIESISYLLSVGITAERLSILGSTYKRKALFLTDKAEKISAYKNAALNYKKAYDINKMHYSAYALTNWLEILSALVMAGEFKWGENDEAGGFTVPTQEEAEILLQDKLSEEANIYDNLDFWNAISKANIMLCQLIVDPAEIKKADWKQPFDEFRKIWSVAGSKAKKMAEVEHLEILLDALKIKNHTPKLIKELEILKNDLKTIL